MKKRILIPILILMSLVVCVSLSACSGDSNDQNDTWEPSVTTDPNVPTEPIIDETAVKNAAAEIFNNFAKNPEGVFHNLQTSKKNLKIDNIYTDAEGMLGYEDPQIETIYLTDHMIHTVYQPTDTYTSEYIPTDEYTFTGDYGTYTIQYDGFTYRYDFSPIEVIDNAGSNIVIPEIAVEQMWYNHSEQCFMLDGVAIVDILKYYITANTVEDSLIDLSSIEAMLDELYIECFFNLNEEMTEIVYFRMLATHIPEDGLISELFSLQYSSDNGNISFKATLNYLLRATLNFKLNKTSDTTYTAEMSALFGATAGVIDQMSMTMSANISVSDEPYIRIGGFLKEKVEIAENLINNSAKIEATYFGRYTVVGEADCEDVYVYDDKIKAYIVFSNYDLDGYTYVGYNPYYDNTMGCLGVLNTEATSITITSHTAEETLEAALRAKYDGQYQCKNDCDTLYIYDEEYEAYILFEQKLGDDFYSYDGYMLEEVFGYCCHSMIDFETNIITVVTHSALEETEADLADLVFEIYNYEKGACAQIIVYDNASGYYLLFSVDGGKARYAGYSSYEFVNACVGELNVGSRTITITDHPHNNAA